MPVHLRLNDKDTSRNPYINFVTALPGPRHDEALHRLQQLAAMVKPLMKEQGFHVNSLEEYEWNREFAGRCWNHGEVVELVLTTARGAWMPLQYVLYVFCHELAHIKHSNHIPHLHGALTRQLKESALQRQREGYFGDGLWSSGRRLGQGDFVAGLGMHQADESLPEHVCGGALARRRGRAPGRRPRHSGASRRRTYRGPSLHTGAQTAPNTRGGNRRVQMAVAESGGGTRIDGRNWYPQASARNSEYKLDENSTFRKRTQSKEAREKRANAALARCRQAAQADVKSDSGVYDANDLRTALERQNRARPTLVPSRAAPECDAYKISDHRSESATASESDSSTEEESELERDGRASGHQSDTGQSEKYTQGWAETSEQRRRRMARFTDGNVDDEQEENGWAHLLQEDARSPVQGQEHGVPQATEPPRKRTIGGTERPDDDDDDEIVFVKQSAKRPARVPTTEAKTITELGTRPDREQRTGPGFFPTSFTWQTPTSREDWTCLLCTLVNDATRTRCAACHTTKGQSVLGA